MSKKKYLFYLFIYDLFHSLVVPQAILRLELDPARVSTIVDIPEELKAKNVMIEAASPLGPRSSAARLSTALVIQLAETVGHVTVRARDTRAPLPRTYVKVYVQPRGSQGVSFHKDGYTDLRGRFDYVSLSEPCEADKFAILVTSATHGSAIVEARAPRS